ncbi:MAG: protein kinase [Planctomycetota bacterium]|nr:protein kinase [Planctomycetota bacterium]
MPSGPDKAQEPNGQQQQDGNEPSISADRPSSEQSDALPGPNPSEDHQSIAQHPAVPSHDAGDSDLPLQVPSLVRPPSTSWGGTLPPIPGYQLLHEISRGGQGVVYQAVQISTHRKVAIKVLLEGLHASPSSRRRFEREIDVISHLKHPNIIAVFDSGMTPDGRLFYVMDYVRGLPVAQYVRENKLDLEQALELFAHICDAVNHAHQKGVIHRDLKPSNILIDADRNLHILDFGLAKAITERTETLATVTGQVVGTMPYMSPEQAKGNPDALDTRTDVYALGVILYEMLTGQYPYPVVGAMAEVLKHIAETPPTPPTRCWTKESGVGPRSARPMRTGRCPIDDEVETITLKALAKERERRYQSAGELARDVRHYLTGEPIEAKRDSAMYLLKKTIRRYRVPVAVALTFVLLLAVFAASMAIQSGRLARERNRANDNAVVAGRERDRAAAKAREAQDNLRLAQANERLAEERLAEGLISSGDSLVKSGRFAAGRDTYYRALGISRQLGNPDVAILAALLESYAKGAPPLMGNDGQRRTIGGFSGHTNPVQAVAFSPDGRMALSGSTDKTLRLWDVATGSQVRSFAGHTEGVYAVAFSPDGRSAISGSPDKSLKLWDVATGREIRSFTGHTDGVAAVAFSPDGRTAISGSKDKTLKLWDVAAGKDIGNFTGHAQWVIAVAFAPDGRTAISGSEDKTLKLWEVASGKEIRRFTGHRETVLAVAFSPDGGTVISGSWDKTLRLWDTATGKEIRSFAGHTEPVLAVAFSPDGHMALSGSADETVKLWEVASGKEVRAFSGHAREVAAVAFSPDGRTAISGSGDRTLKLWDLASGNDVRTLIWRGRKVSKVSSVAFSPDGRTAISGSADRTLKLWDMATGKEIRSFSGHEDRVRIVAFSPDGLTVISGSEDKTLKLWDLASGKEIRTFMGHGGGVSSVAFSPSGHTVISGSVDTTLKLWDVASAKEIRAFIGHAGPVSTVAFSPDGRTALSASSDKTMKLWDVATGRDIQTFPGRMNSVHLSFSPDGRSFISASAMGSLLKLWDVASGKEIRDFTQGTESVSTIVFSPDGRTGLAGGFKTLSLWDVASGTETRSWAAHADSVSPVTLSPDGLMVLSAGEAGRINLWDFGRGPQYREFEPRVEKARTALWAKPNDPASLAAFGEWYAFRGVHGWAVEFLEKAKAAGGAISYLTLARCYWQLNSLPEAKAAFELALQRQEAPEPYLKLCLQALDHE